MVVMIHPLYTWLMYNRVDIFGVFEQQWDGNNNCDWESTFFNFNTHTFNVFLLFLYDICSQSFQLFLWQNSLSCSNFSSNCHFRLITSGCGLNAHMYITRIAPISLCDYWPIRLLYLVQSVCIHDHWSQLVNNWFSWSTRPICHATVGQP